MNLLLVFALIAGLLLPVQNVNAASKKKVLVLYRLPSAAVVSILETTDFSSNSPDSKMFFRCFEIAAINNGIYKYAICHASHPQKMHLTARTIVNKKIPIYNCLNL